MHRASFAPRDPPRTPTTKDFPEEGRPVEKGQPSRLSAPNRPKQGSDKFDVLPFHKVNQIANDGARLIRVVRRVGDDRGAVRASQLQSTAQLFWFGRIERLARNVAVSGGVHFGIEIGQPHVDPKGRKAASERAVAAARIEGYSWQFES
jgi:hypothetical protein